MKEHRDTPIVCGVYFLFKAEALIYVGQSKDCYARIADHRTKGRDFDLATVMPLQSEFLSRVEAALIKSYRPTKNVMHNGVPAPRGRPPRAFAPASPPTPSAPLPTADGLGTISRSKARQLALALGLRMDVINEGIADGKLRFAESRKSGRGTVSVALFAEVEAFLKAKQTERLAELGLA